jgi:hypothetical protein
MAQPSWFKFTANTLDGRILEFPKVVNMLCDKVIPLYQDIVKAYDKDECIVAREVYLVNYGGHLYGTTDFTTMDEFVSYRNSNCRCVLVNGNCVITYNGMPILFN